MRRSIWSAKRRTWAMSRAIPSRADSGQSVRFSASSDNVGYARKRGMFACRFTSQKTHMTGLWPPAPDHETDFAASPSTAQYRMNAVRPCAAGFKPGA